MKRGGLMGILLLFGLCLSLHGAEDQDLRRSVVKIFSTRNSLSIGSPWKRGDGQEATGSGVWLGKRRVLTNHHLVVHATQISVQPYESADRIPADVVAVSPEMDLAILEMDEESPFSDLAPPTLSEKIPSLQSRGAGLRISGRREFPFGDGGNCFAG